MRSSTKAGSERTRRRRAVRLSVESLEGRVVLSATPPAWVSIGPTPITDPFQQNLNFDGTYVSPPEMTGAIQAIATYETPQGTQGAYVGAALGGVWQTPNLFPGTPTWSTHSDSMPSLAISSLGVSPLDKTGATVFAGTGPTSNGGVSWKGYGAYPDLSTLDTGLYRSTDGGLTWTALNGPSSPVYGTFIAKVLPTTIGADLASETVLVGTQRGLFVSTDAGATFSAQTFTNPVLDVVEDPLNAQRFYLLAGPDSHGDGAGVYRSDDAGQSWKSINGGAIDSQVLSLMPTNGQDNGAGRLAVTTQGGNTLLYMTFERNDDQNTYGVFRTAIDSKGDADWKAYYLFPNDEDGGSGNNLGLAVDPSDPDIVYTDGYGGNSTYRLNPGSSGTATLTELTSEDAGSLYDVRGLAFATDPDGHEVLLATSDSGVYALKDPTTAPTLPTWKPLMGNISVTESYSVAAMEGPFGQLEVGGGAQDTAAFQSTISPGGQTSWVAVNGGDGFGTSYDPASGMLYATSDNLGDLQVAQAGTNTIEPVTFTGWDSADRGNASTFPSLVAVSAANVGGTFSPRPVVFAGYGLYEAQPASLTSGQVSVTEVKAPGDGSDTYSALSFGGTYQGAPDPYILYAAKGDGTLWFSDTFGTAVTKLASWNHGTIVGLQQDPANSHVVYALTKTALYVSEDAGQTWNSYAAQPPSGTLGSFLGLGLVSTSLNGVPTNLLLVGGLHGAVVSADSSALGSTPWAPVGSNLPNAMVTSFAYVPGLDDLVLATFGRGDWLLSDAAERLVYSLGGETSVSVSAPGTTTFGASALLSAVVTPVAPGQPAPTGSVTFAAVGGGAETVLGSATIDATGRAQLLLPSGLPAGTTKIAAEYSGDTDFAGSDGEAATSVVPSGTSIGLTAPATVSATLPLRLVAAVTGSTSATPAGSVTFYADGTPLGSAAVGATGTASLTVPAPPLGTRSLTAAFEPSDTGQFTASVTAAPLTVQVVTNAPTSVATSAVLAAATVRPPGLRAGRLVEFDVQVLAGPGTVVSGVLELLAGGRVVATGVLDGSGRATFTVPPGRVLNRPVTALYLGGSAGGAPAAACQSATFVPTARWFRTHHAPSATARHPSANGHGRGRS